jgi:hypothetical protein
VLEGENLFLLKTVLVVNNSNEALRGKILVFEVENKVEYIKLILEKFKKMLFMIK